VKGKLERVWFKKYQLQRLRVFGGKIIVGFAMSKGNNKFLGVKKVGKRFLK